ARTTRADDARRDRDEGRAERIGDEPKHVDPEDDEQDAADALEPEHQLAGEGADEGDRDPQEREYRSESENERERMRDRAQSLRPGERRLASDVHEEGGHEREHAGREEREEPRPKGGGDVHRIRRSAD